MNIEMNNARLKKYTIEFKSFILIFTGKSDRLKKIREHMLGGGENMSIFEYSPRKWPMTQVQKYSKILMFPPPPVFNRHVMF